jgi:hypothetical protein
MSRTSVLAAVILAVFVVAVSANDTTPLTCWMSPGAGNMTGIYLVVRNVSGGGVGVQSYTFTSTNFYAPYFTNKSAAYSLPIVYDQMYNVSWYFYNTSGGPYVGQENTTTYLGRGNYVGNWFVTNRTETPSLGLTAIIQSGILDHYKMNDNSATTVVVDSIGGKNGIAYSSTNSMHTTGQIDGALTVGATNYIYFSNNGYFSFERTDPFSVAFWVKGSGNQNGILFGKNSDESHTTKGWLVFIAGVQGHTYLQLNGGTSAGANELQCSDQNGDILDNTWHHVVVTYNGSSAVSGVHIYRDGVSRSLTTDFNTLSASIINTYGARIGRTFSDTYKLSASVDDLRVYSKELSATEVGLIYNGGVGTEDDGASGKIVNFTQFENGAKLDADLRVLGNIAQGNSQATGTSSVALGNGSTASGTFSGVLSGNRNIVSVIRSTIAGGQLNNIAGELSFIGGGSGNSIPGYGGLSVIGGGTGNAMASGPIYNSFIGGGTSNYISGNNAVIGGGYGNVDTANYGAICGGYSNSVASGNWPAVVGGGAGNYAIQDSATVSGGVGNRASANGASIGGGLTNTASGVGSVVGGGKSNTVSNNYAGVGSGHSNNAMGASSVIAGGSTNTAGASYYVGQCTGTSGNLCSDFNGNQAACEQPSNCWLCTINPSTAYCAGGQFPCEGLDTYQCGYTYGMCSIYTQCLGGDISCSDICNGAGNPEDCCDNGYGMVGCSWNYGTSNCDGTVHCSDYDNNPYYCTGVLSGYCYNNDVCSGGYQNCNGLYDPGACSMASSWCSSWYAGDCVGDMSCGSCSDPTDCGYMNGCSWLDFATTGYNGVCSGLNNQATGEYAVISGGTGNTASGDYSSVVGGGINQQATGKFSFIGGGGSNMAQQEASAVVSGGGNNVNAVYSVIAGGGNNIITDSSQYGSNSFIGSGSYNYITGISSVIGGGWYNTVKSAGGSSNFAVIGGGRQNFALYDWTTVGGGYINNASNIGATVAGGVGNIASGFRGVVGGGNGNVASGYGSGVLSGASNLASYYWATVGGGVFNTAAGNASTVAGGQGNTVASTTKFSTIGGGLWNNISKDNSTISGGVLNKIYGPGSVVAGGVSNIANSTYSVIGGGTNNTIKYNGGIAADYSVIAGGLGNNNNGWDSVISGGRNNLVYNANAQDNFIGGGVSNTVGNFASVVVGGEINKATAADSAVVGGWLNLASGAGAVAVGGSHNTASQKYAGVASGAYNTASGYYAGVASGKSNVASGDYSMAGTYAVTASAANSIAFGSSFTNNMPNSFQVGYGAVRLIVNSTGIYNATTRIG